VEEEARRELRELGRNVRTTGPEGVQQSTQQPAAYLFCILKFSKDSTNRSICCTGL
jgi:hypothetical protein